MYAVDGKCMSFQQVKKRRKYRNKNIKERASLFYIVVYIVVRFYLKRN